MHHHLKSSPETVHWGWFDAALPHVLTIGSGDRVTIESISGGPKNLPGEGFGVPPELLEVHAKSQQRMPGHILTGPVGVRGAQPGDVLEVRVLEVELRQDWGYTVVRPLAGALPDDIDAFEQIHTRLDRDKKIRSSIPWRRVVPTWTAGPPAPPEACWPRVFSTAIRSHWCRGAHAAWS